MTTTADSPTKKGWTVDDSTFGARLALVRQRMDWNLKEAAIECGLPPASWKNWERDSSEPRRLIETVTLISNRTGCDFLWLLTGSNARTTAQYDKRRTSPQVRQGSKPRQVTRPSERVRHDRPPTVPAASRRPSLLRTA